MDYTEETCAIMKRLKNENDKKCIYIYAQEFDERIDAPPSHEEEMSEQNAG